MSFYKLKIASSLKNISLFTFGIISFGTSVFALLSGSEEYGGGLRGVIYNFPNALPWLSLLVLGFVAWKHELIGGLLITAAGLFLLYFFCFSGPVFFLPFVLTIVVILTGLAVLFSWVLRRGV